MDNAGTTVPQGESRGAPSASLLKEQRQVFASEEPLIRTLFDAGNSSPSARLAAVALLRGPSSRILATG